MSTNTWYEEYQDHECNYVCPGHKVELEHRNTSGTFTYRRDGEDMFSGWGAELDALLLMLMRDVNPSMESAVGKALAEMGWTNPTPPVRRDV